MGRIDKLRETSQSVTERLSFGPEKDGVGRRCVPGRCSRAQPVPPISRVRVTAGLGGRADVTRIPPVLGEQSHWGPDTARPRRAVAVGPGYRPSSASSRSGPGYSPSSASSRSGARIPPVLGEQSQWGPDTARPWRAVPLGPGSSPSSASSRSGARIQPVLGEQSQWARIQPVLGEQSQWGAARQVVRLRLQRRPAASDWDRYSAEQNHPPLSTSRPHQTDQRQPGPNE